MTEEVNHTPFGACAGLLVRHDADIVQRYEGKGPYSPSMTAGLVKPQSLVSLRQLTVEWNHSKKCPKELRPAIPLVRGTS